MKRSMLRCAALAASLVWLLGAGGAAAAAADKTVAEEILAILREEGRITGQQSQVLTEKPRA